MSPGLVLSFLRRAPQAADWTQQELAEFYRVESALLQGGLSVTTDRGLTDEGDPWLVFCRADNEEVIAHFARIAGEYVIVSNIYSGAARGRDFRLLVRQMLDMHPLMLPARRASGQKVFLHPAALLTALLASAYILSNDNSLTGDHGGADSEGRAGTLTSLLRHKFAITSVVALAAAWLEHQSDLVAKLFDNLPFLPSHGDERPITVADADHQVAPLDALGQAAAKMFEASSHRADLAKQVVDFSVVQDGSDHGQPVVPQNSLPSFAQVAVSDRAGVDASAAGANDVLAANVAVSSWRLDGGAGQTDADSGFGAAKIAAGHGIIVGSIGGDATSELLVGNLQSVSLVSSPVISSNALQLASEFSGSSMQTVLLSSGPLPLQAALQQAFVQVGLSDHQILSAPDTGLHPSPDAGPVTTTPSVPTSVSTVPLATTPDPVVSTSPGLPTSGPAFAALESFLHNTPSFEIAVSGVNVVIIDTNVADINLPGFAVQTFNMSDGSTLSLVGIISHPATIAA